MTFDSTDRYHLPAPGKSAAPLVMPGERNTKSLPSKKKTSAAKQKEATRSRWSLFNGFVDKKMATLNPSVSIVWMALFRMAKTNGRVFASLERLAALTGLHRRTVQHAVKILCDSGYVEKTQRGGGYAATRYRIVTPDKGEGRQIVPE